MTGNKIALNGVLVYPFASISELLSEVAVQKKILVAINAEKILNATEQTRQIVNRNIGYADGIGAVLALKKKGEKEVVKIPGCELWLKIIECWYQEKKFYLVGGKQEVIEATVAKLKKEYPGIDIVNYRNGYIKTPEERQKLLEDIRRGRPDVVFVAMGSPKQELLMEEMLRIHPAVYQGLGGSFDVYTGNVKRAPGWWVRHNLEWAYRLLKQPTRIRRQVGLVRFLWLLLWNKI